MNFSRNIRDLRERRGETQEAFAEALGVSKRAVQQWEAGVSAPPIGRVAHMARALGVDESVLLGGGGREGAGGGSLADVVARLERLGRAERAAIRALLDALDARDGA